MTAQKGPFVWGGRHPFSITGTGRHEDTIRVTAEQVKTEKPLSLTLPTLCITYADLQFANAIGGVQENYPASAAYGPAFFDPPVEITGEAEVERLTWIRGAHRVVIARKETLIEWFPWRTLVIPRLRVDGEKGARAWLTAEEVPIAVNEPLVIKVKQLANGRHIGGIRLEKRHPDWHPPEPPKDYDLFVRVLHGETHQPLPETRVNVFRWEPKYNGGGFVLDDQAYTDGQGLATFRGRPAGELEAVALDMPGWRATPRAFRSLPGQQARFHLFAWPLKDDSLRYTWQPGDDLDRMARAVGRDPGAILAANRLPSPAALRPGMAISLPCYAATYTLEPGDSFKELALQFGFEGPEELAKANGLPDVSALKRGLEIVLPGWYYFIAGRGDTLESMDKLLNLRPGSARTVGRTYRPHRQWLYEGEVVALPAP
jgi:hypothetical protein